MRRVLVRNTGCIDAVVDSIVHSDGRFLWEGAGSVIAPGDSVFLVVRFFPTGKDGGASVDSAVIHSSDASFGLETRVNVVLPDTIALKTIIAGVGPDGWVGYVVLATDATLNTVYLDLSLSNDGFSINLFRPWDDEKVSAVDTVALSDTVAQVAIHHLWPVFSKGDTLAMIGGESFVTVHDTTVLSTRTLFDPDDYRLCKSHMRPPQDVVLTSLACGDPSLKRFLRHGDLNVRIVPNPSDESVRFESKKTVLKVEAWSSEGRLVAESNGPDVDVSKLANGTYHAMIVLDGGLRVGAKFVVSR